MQKTTKISPSSKAYLLCLFFLFSIQSISSQYIFKENSIPKRISIHNQTEFIDVKDKNLTLEEVLKISDDEFKDIPNENYDFGFTNSHIWLRFELKNETDDSFSLYFETARPITDYATLYVLKDGKLVTKYISGDAVPYNQRSFDLRKTIFKIRLTPNETKQFYLHVKSDSEMLSMPLLLRKSENLLAENDFEQFIFAFCFQQKLVKTF